MAVGETQMYEPIHAALLVKGQAGLISSGTKCLAYLGKYCGAEYPSTSSN